MNDRYLFKAKRVDNGKWVQGYYYQIWENDICDRKEQYPEIVKYCNGDWTLDYSYVSNKKSGANYCNLGFYTEERKCVEVIGNIFDNPELLESEK